MHLTEELPLAEREKIEKFIIILYTRLDQHGLKLLVRRTTVPFSSVDFSGPYRQIARSLMQQAVAQASVSEVVMAAIKFFKDRNYNLPPEEVSLLESF